MPCLEKSLISKASPRLRFENFLESAHSRQRQYISTSFPDLRNHPYLQTTKPFIMYFPTNISSALILLTTLTASTSAFSVTSYSGRQCRSQSLGTVIQVPDSGCQKAFAGVAASATLSGDASDANYFMMYFSSDDCNPDNIITRGDLGKDWKTTCVTPETSYASFQVYNVCEKPGCLD